MRLPELALAGKTIPRAGGEAIVAAVNAIANGRAEFDRDRAFQFDGEVGNATACLELKRGGNRRGGTGREATSAGAASVVLGPIRLQAEGRQDFGEKEPVSQSPADQVRVLA